MRKILLSICFAYGLLLINSNSAQAITVEVFPHYQEVNVNSQVSVDIFISDLGVGAAPSLSSFDLNIIYDPAILSFPGMSGVIFGDQLDLFGFGLNVRTVDNSTPGIINISEASFDLPDDLNNLQLPDFTLVTLTFDTLLVGMSTLTMEINALGDAYGNPLMAEVTGAQINAVPIPGAAWLFYSGLACLMAMRRKR